jgi:LysM repeat protein
MIPLMRGNEAFWGLAAAALLLGGCVPYGGSRAPSIDPEVRPGSTPPRSTVRGEPDDLLRDIPLRTPDEATRWSASPVAANAREVTPRSYTVQPGDTLRGIGNRTGAGSEEIARANGLAPPYVIRPGQVLQIPGGRYHEVAAGQTGIAIARAYGVPWSAIIAENQLTEPYVLRVGQRLRLPAGAAPEGPPPAPADDRRTGTGFYPRYRQHHDRIGTGGGAAAGGIARHRAALTHARWRCPIPMARAWADHRPLWPGGCRACQ